MLSASAVLALAGCGGDPSSQAQPAETKRNGGLYDAVDVCGLATDDQLKAALGAADEREVIHRDDLVLL